MGRVQNIDPYGVTIALDQGQGGRQWWLRRASVALMSLQFEGEVACALGRVQSATPSTVVMADVGAILTCDVRAYPRIGVTTAVRARIRVRDTIEDGHVINVSRSGILCRTERPVDTSLGTQVEAELHWSDLRLTVPGLVVRLQDRDVALALRPATSEQRDILTQLVRAQLQQD